MQLLKFGHKCFWHVIAFINRADDLPIFKNKFNLFLYKLLQFSVKNINIYWFK